jgi:amylosucrase
MDWEKAKLRKKKDTVEGKVFSAIRQLEKIRARYKVFDGLANVSVIDTGDSAVLGIKRIVGDKKLIALFNFGENHRFAKTGEGGELTDLWTKKKMNADQVLLASGEFVWLANY